MKNTTKKIRPDSAEPREIMIGRTKKNFFSKKKSRPTQKKVNGC